LPPWGSSTCSCGGSLDDIKQMGIPRTMDLPILDNHVHLRPEGENVEAARRFARAGGTALNITCYPKWEHLGKPEYYRMVFEAAIGIARRVASEVGILTLVTVGPYPVDLVRLLSMGWRPERAREYMIEGALLAAELCQEGVAHAIGEVGRPHFQVKKEVWDLSNEILEEIMSIAAEHGCPVVLHTESATEDTFAELASMASRAGLRPEMVVKHYSPPIVEVEKTRGIWPSVIASRRNAREAARRGRRFLLETDFLDDPSRPNAVLPIDSVPRRVKMLLQEGLLSEEDVYVVMKENPKRIYGVEVPP